MDKQNVPRPAGLTGAAVVAVIAVLLLIGATVYFSMRDSVQAPQTTATETVTDESAAMNDKKKHE